MIGLRFESDIPVANYSVNIGRIEIGSVFLTTSENAENNHFVTVSYPVQSNHSILFNINWQNAKQLNYTLYDLQGRMINPTVSISTALQTIR